MCIHPKKRDFIFIEGKSSNPVALTWMPILRYQYRINKHYGGDVTLSENDL